MEQEEFLSKNLSKIVKKEFFFLIKIKFFVLSLNSLGYYIYSKRIKDRIVLKMNQIKFI